MLVFLISHILYGDCPVRDLAYRMRESKAQIVDNLTFHHKKDLKRLERKLLDERLNKNAEKKEKQSEIYKEFIQNESEIKSILSKLEKRIKCLIDENETETILLSNRRERVNYLINNVKRRSAHRNERML